MEMLKIDLHKQSVCGTKFKYMSMRVLAFGL